MTDPGNARGPDRAERRRNLASIVDDIRSELDAKHQARELALPACRRAIRSAGSAIRAVHRREAEAIDGHLSASVAAIRDAQAALAPHPEIQYAGFLLDAEKEVAEAQLLTDLVDGRPLRGPGELELDQRAWLRGLAEAASELRRHLLDRLREGEIERGEELLATMDDVYDALVGVDYPDAITAGLRRTVDAFRGVLERTRADVTTTVLQTRLQRAIEAADADR
ncbi:MAG: haloacid dehalogenase [Actinomycetota bacterium]|nr:haloacid dehalogenase [Actinomycetota bacterium]